MKPETPQKPICSRCHSTRVNKAGVRNLGNGRAQYYCCLDCRYVFRRPGDKPLPNIQSAKVAAKFSRLAQVRANRPACPFCKARDTYSNGNRDRNGVKTPYYRCGQCNRSFFARENRNLDTLKMVSTELISTEPISTDPITAETPSARIVDFQQVTEPLELSLQSPINLEVPPPLETPPNDSSLKVRVALKKVMVGSIGLQSFPVQAVEQTPPAAMTEQTDVIEPNSAVQSPQPKLAELKLSESKPSATRTLKPQSLEPQPQDKRHDKPQPEIRPLEPSPWPTHRTLEQTRPLVWTLPDVQNLMLESSRTHQQNLALFAHPGIPEAVLKNMSEPIQAYLHSRQALDLATALWQCLNAVTAREGLIEHSKPDETSQVDAVKTAEEFVQLEHERDDILVERNQLQRELTLLSRQKFKLEAELANVRASAVWYDKQKVNAASSGSTPSSAPSQTKTLSLQPVVESKSSPSISSPSISSPSLSSPSTSTFTPSKSNRIAPPLYTVAEQRELQRRTNLLVATLARCEYYRLRISDVSTVTGDPGPWRVVLEYAITSKLIERWSDFVQMTMTERTRRKLP